MSDATIEKENKPTTDVGKAARQGGVWSVIGYVFSRVTGFASSVVLARLLMPEHFGLIAMVNTVLGLVQMIGNFGIASALMHQREDVDEYANTTWWSTIIAGVILYCLVCLATPIAVHYYHEPRVRLLIAVAGVNFIITAIGGTISTLILRSLRFKDNTRIGLCSALCTSTFTIFFALLGAGVWSFVFPSIIANVLTVILVWRACTFRPRWPVDWSLLNKLLGFGVKVFGARIFDYVNQNIDYMMVGAMMGRAQLGFYFFAYNQATWVVQNISGMITNLTFPTFASLQHERDRARDMFLKLIRMISLVGFPIVAMQWALAPLYIGSIYGTKWMPSIVAFRLIAVYGMGRTVCAPGGTLMAALGRPDVNLKLSAGLCPILVAAIFIGSRHGINGVAVATMLAHGVFVWLYLVIPFMILNWKIGSIFTALVPAFVSSIVAAAFVTLCYKSMGSPNNSLVSLGILLAIGVVVYAFAMFVLFRSVAKESLDTARTAICEMKERRRAATDARIQKSSGSAQQ